MNASMHFLRGKVTNYGLQVGKLLFTAVVAVNTVAVGPKSLQHAEHSAIYLNRHSLPEDLHFHDEAEARPTTEQLAGHAGEDPIRNLHWCARLDAILQAHRCISRHESMNAAQIVLDASLIQNRQALSNEFRFQGFEARLGVSVEKQIAGEQGQVRGLNSISGTCAVFLER